MRFVQAFHDGTVHSVLEWVQLDQFAGRLRAFVPVNSLNNEWVIDRNIIHSLITVLRRQCLSLYVRTSPLFSNSCGLRETSLDFKADNIPNRAEVLREQVIE